MDIWFDLISNQINDIKLMWEESKEEVFTQRNGGALLLTKRRKTDGDDSTKRGITVQMNRDTPTIQRTETQDKYVSVSTGVLSSSIHIQLFSQNQPPLSSIENQIFIKRMIEE